MAIIDHKTTHNDFRPAFAAFSSKLRVVFEIQQTAPKLAIPTMHHYCTIQNVMHLIGALFGQNVIQSRAAPSNSR
jgi:hypothetical protein